MSCFVEVFRSLWPGFGASSKVGQGECSEHCEEFQEFAVKGNVVDMAVGIIIGGAFGKIVASVVNDVIMPPIGLLLGGVNFTDLAVTLKAANEEAGTAAVLLKYGSFLQTVVDFLIVAWAVFLLVKLVNRLRQKTDAAAQKA